MPRLPRMSYRNTIIKQTNKPLDEPYEYRARLTLMPKFSKCKMEHFRAINVEGVIAENFPDQNYTLSSEQNEPR